MISKHAHKSLFTCLNYRPRCRSSKKKDCKLLLVEGKSWPQIQELLGCSRFTIATVKKLTAAALSNLQKGFVTN